MRKTYHGKTAGWVTRNMQPDPQTPSIYWVNISGADYRVVAHRGDVEMRRGYGSSIVLETPEERVVLAWSGRPASVVAATGTN